MTALRRAGLTDIDHTTLTQFTEAFEPERVDVDAAERPPIVTIPAYCEKFGLELRAAG